MAHDMDVTHRPGCSFYNSGTVCNCTPIIFCQCGYPRKPCIKRHNHVSANCIADVESSLRSNVGNTTPVTDMSEVRAESAAP